MCNRKIIKCGILLIIMLILLISIPVGIKRSFTEKRIKTGRTVYSYVYSPTGSYSVNVKQNNYFTEGKLEEGGKYAHNIVDSIHINFCGDFIGDKKAEITTEYKMVAKLEGYQMSSGSRDSIWEKEIPIGEVHSDTVTDYSTKYEAAGDINIREYEDMVAGIKSELGITLTIDLTVYLEGSIKAKYGEENEDEKVNIPLKSIVTIPLNTVLFSIDKDVGSSLNEEVVEYYEVKSRRSGKDRAVWLMVWLTLFGTAIMIAVFIKDKPGDEREAEERLRRRNERRIIRKYGDRLVAISGMPSVCINEIYVVSTVEDIMKIALELGRPAMYIKGEDGLMEEGRVFVIEADDKYIYFVE